MYVFDVASGSIEEEVKVGDVGAEVIGVFQHPFRNIIGTISDVGVLKLWKP